MSGERGGKRLTVFKPFLGRRQPQAVQDVANVIAAAGPENIELPAPVSTWSRVNLTAVPATRADGADDTAPSLPDPLPEHLLDHTFRSQDSIHSVHDVFSAKFQPHEVPLTAEDVVRDWKGKWDVIIVYPNLDKDKMLDENHSMFHGMAELKRMMTSKIGLGVGRTVSKTSKTPETDEWGDRIMSNKQKKKSMSTKPDAADDDDGETSADEEEEETGDVETAQRVKVNKKLWRRKVKRNKLIKRMKLQGLIVAKQFSVDQNYVLLKIAAPLDLLAYHAEIMALNMPLKFEGNKRKAALGRQATNLVSRINRRLQGRQPVKIGYAPYRRGMEEHFDLDPSRTFRSLDRQRIILKILESPKWEGGCEMDMNELVEQRVWSDYYTLHSENGQKRLYEQWLWNKHWQMYQPREEIANYFGPKICFYFEYLRYYIKWLIVLSVAGILVMIYAWGKHNFKLNGQVDGASGWAPAVDLDNFVVCLFSLFMCIWCSLFIEKWKRKQNAIAFQFNIVNISASTQARPEFVGTPVKGQITEFGLISYEEMGLTDEELDKIDEYVLWYPVLSRYLRQAAGIPVLTTFAITVVVGTLAIFVFKRTMDGRGSWEGSLLGSVINAVFIMAMNTIYQKVAVLLNDCENHRTDIDYEDALIVKTFVFQFINSYISLFFIAFLKNPPIPQWAKQYQNGTDISEDLYPEEFTPKSAGQFDMGSDGTVNLDIGHCTQSSCMLDLFYQLAILLVVKQFASNLQENIVPWMQGRWQGYLRTRAARRALQSAVDKQLEQEEVKKSKKSRAQLKKDAAELADEKMPFIEKQGNLPKHAGTFYEYNELMIQFGYMTMFASAFPLAAVFALLNNVFEIRLDAVKMLSLARRPLYEDANGIGTWLAIINFMSNISTITNIAIVCFTSNYFKGKWADRTTTEWGDCVLACKSKFTTSSAHFADWEAGHLAALPDNWLNNATAYFNTHDSYECVRECNCEGLCYDVFARLVIFVLLEHAVFLLKIVIDWAYSDVPRNIARAGVWKSRIETIMKKKLAATGDASIDDESALERWDLDLDEEDEDTVNVFEDGAMLSFKRSKPKTFRIFNPLGTKRNMLMDSVAEDGEDTPEDDDGPVGEARELQDGQL